VSRNCHERRCHEQCVEWTRVRCEGGCRSALVGWQCSMMQYTASCCCTPWRCSDNSGWHCNALQHAATRCNIGWHCKALQRCATRCNTLQHTATHCNTLQHAVQHAVTSNGCCPYLEGPASTILFAQHAIPPDSGTQAIRMYDIKAITMQYV